MSETTETVIDEVKAKLSARADSKPWAVIWWSALDGAVVGFLVGVLVF